MASHDRSASFEDTGGVSDTPRRPPTKRIRLACRRCQTRKIKCDGGLPKCSNCQRTGTECHEGKQIHQEGSISREEAVNLHNQIQRLEQALRTQNPNYNLEDIRPQRPSDTEPDRASATSPSSTNDVAVPRNAPEVALRSSSPSRSQSRNEIAHELGLVPLSTGVNKYVGPSSGLSFAKLVFARAGQNQRIPQMSQDSTAQESPSTTSSRQMFTIGPSALPPTIEQAVQLSKIYFEYVHIHYPFLFQPQHFRLLHDLYKDPTSASQTMWFQATMVLAISASILSKRLRIPFTGEGLCTSAMQYVDNIDFQNSVEGVQCLLLVAMFTLHSPFLGVNPWYLNYQCIAAVLDLGLQRDVPTSPNINAFDREMRTRVFWVIYCIDRTLATALGRPIGLRDEACDLRLPNGYDDLEAVGGPIDLTGQSMSFQRTEAMSCAIVLFQLAQMNSEIKYILHSVTKNTPKYTYPQIPDIDAWQSHFWERLQEINNQIPHFHDQWQYLSTICHVRYHEVVMHLFRPTPRIRTPNKPSLIRCHESAKVTIDLWKSLYESDRMSYSWITIHSVSLSALTMLYCIWMVPEIATSTRIDSLMASMQDCSILLSAAGEHWAEARRGRNSIDSLATATVRWLVDGRMNLKPQQKSRQRTGSRNADQARLQKQSIYSGLDNTSDTNDAVGNMPRVTVATNQQQHDTTAPSYRAEPVDTWADMQGIDTYINNRDLAVFLGNSDPLSDDVFLTMDGMFSDFQPTFDFNPAIDMNQNFFL